MLFRSVIHAKYRVTSNRFYGVPPMASCAPAFEQALQSRAVQKYLFQNLASPGMVLLAPGKIDESVARKLQTEWDNNFSGTGTGKTVVLSNGLDAKPVLWKAGDQQLLEQIQASVQDIARAFSIPQFYLEHLQTATFASASEQTRALWWSAQKPFTMRLADAMALKLISRNDRAAGAGIEFDLNASLVMPGKEMSDFLGGLVNAGICTPNELRNSYLNLPDQPGGDVLRAPANSTSADTSLAGAKAWDRARTYAPGTLCLHAAGVWRAAVETTNDEPRQDSADWDCLVGGVTAAAFEDGELTLRLSGGHSIKALQ